MRTMLGLNSPRTASEPIEDNIRMRRMPGEYNNVLVYIAAQTKRHANRTSTAISHAVGYEYDIGELILDQLERRDYVRWTLKNLPDMGMLRRIYAATDQGRQYLDGHGLLQ